LYHSLPCFLRHNSPQVGVALLTGKTGAPPASEADGMSYDAETVVTEGGLEAVAQASYSLLRGWWFDVAGESW